MTALAVATFAPWHGCTFICGVVKQHECGRRATSVLREINQPWLREGRCAVHARMCAQEIESDHRLDGVASRWSGWWIEEIQ